MKDLKKRLVDKMKLKKRLLEKVAKNRLKEKAQKLQSSEPRLEEQCLVGKPKPVL